MDLFDYMRSNTMEKEAPLASRLRPSTLDEVVGQKHIIGKDKLLYRAIKADKLGSIIFYGPPGTGKTTLAKVIANTTSARFTQINATVAGKKDMEEVVKEAKDALGMYGQKTILFVDEIHRFNKSQQDYLLPFVEDGTLLLIGATTENPYFEVNGALISRSRIFELKQLEKDDIKELLRRAVTDSEKGMGMYQAVLEPEAEEFLADMANGDARAALNAVELGILTTERAEDGLIHIDLDVAQECIQKRAVRYDKGGDNHYDTISAFIKSMRGSDPDAAVYYLARMLYAGEDIKFIARRIMICASEDVGNADPMALTVAVSASLAVERVGMPEAQIILSNAASYVACAPKSNSAVNAIDAAMKAVKTQTLMPVPPHLQDRHYSGAAALGRGLDYKYAHDYPNHYVKQQYLPDGMEGAVFYEPSDNGYEKEIKARLAFPPTLFPTPHFPAETPAHEPADSAHGLS
jgi:putative ATPase